MSKQQPETKTNSAGHWFVITASTLGILSLGKQLKIQAFFGNSLIYTRLIVLMLKGQRRTCMSTV